MIETLSSNRGLGEDVVDLAEAREGEAVDACAVYLGKVSPLFVIFLSKKVKLWMHE